MRTVCGIISIMLRKLHDVITLQFFAVTRARRLYFVGAVFAVLAILLLNDYITTLLAEFTYVSILLEIILFTLSVYVLTSGLRLIAVSRYRKKKQLDSEDNDNFTIGASVLVGTITTCSTIVWIFGAFDIGFVTFLTSIALFSVALATIFKDTIKDFIEGLVILFTGTYNIGDYVQVGSHPRGMIVDVTLSKTKLRTEDGNTLHISNSTINSSAVLNLSEANFSWIKVSASIPQKAKPATVVDAILSRLQAELPEHVIEDRCVFSVGEISKDTVELQCDIAIHDFSFQTERNIKNLINSYLLEITTSKTRKK